MAEAGAATADAPLLAEGAEFEGTLVLHGAARIDGRARGRVLGAGRLAVGCAGHLEADIEADELVVAGCLEGTIRATGRVCLLGTARVRGRLETPRLEMEEGAVFDGACRVGDAPGAVRKEPAAP